MKRIAFFLMATLCAMPGALRAQDAAVEEKLNQLIARIDILAESQDAQRKRIEALEKELDTLQQRNNKGESYASLEDVKQLAAKLQEMERKRQQDNEHILREIGKLGSKLALSPRAPAASSESAAEPGPGFKYVIQSGDTLLAVVQAYKDKNIKVTVEQIVKANPGLDPRKLPIGREIFIPAPQ